MEPSPPTTPSPAPSENELISNFENPENLTVEPSPPTSPSLIPLTSENEKYFMVCSIPDQLVEIDSREQNTDHPIAHGSRDSHRIFKLDRIHIGLQDDTVGSSTHSTQNYTVDPETDACVFVPVPGYHCQITTTSNSTTPEVLPGTDTEDSVDNIKSAPIPDVSQNMEHSEEPLAGHDQSQRDNERLAEDFTRELQLTTAYLDTIGPSELAAAATLQCLAAASASRRNALQNQPVPVEAIAGPSHELLTSETPQTRRARKRPQGEYLKSIREPSTETIDLTDGNDEPHVAAIRRPRQTTSPNFFSHTPLHFLRLKEPIQTEPLPLVTVKKNAGKGCKRTKKSKDQ